MPWHREGIERAWKTRGLGAAATGAPKPWEETREAFGERMRMIARHINAEHDVDALCRAFPGRIQQLIDTDGDSLSK